MELAIVLCIAGGWFIGYLAIRYYMLKPGSSAKLKKYVPLVTSVYFFWFFLLSTALLTIMIYFYSMYLRVGEQSE